MKLLLTCFDPFGNDKLNSSFEALKLVDEWMFDAYGMTVRKAVLPTEYDGSVKVLFTALDEFDPDVLICTGQAGGSPKVQVERIAVNLDDSGVADNSGEKRADAPIEAGGPDGIFATIPVKQIVSALNEAGISASISYSAGAYVCNHVMYSALRRFALHKPHAKCGFIHLPYVPEQIGDGSQKSSMPAAEAARAVMIAAGIAAGIRA